METENKNLEIVILKNVIKYIDSLVDMTIESFIMKYWNSASFCDDLHEYGVNVLQLWANNPTQILCSIENYFKNDGYLYDNFTDIESIINNVALDYIKRLLSKYENENFIDECMVNQIHEDLCILLADKQDDFKETIQLF